MEDVARRYAVAVSPTLLALVDPADPNDPIARQFLPSLEELNTLPEERADPIGDHAHSPVPGIVHRHPDRVLFKVVAACPVYCRFCFRREMIGPGQNNALSKDDFEAALAYIADHAEIWEVILTGGDPFILSPRRVAEITSRLAEHRACENRALAHPRAGDRSGPHHRRSGRGVCRRRAPPLSWRCMPIIRASFRRKRAAPSHGWRKARSRWSASRCCSRA